jgi:undecaprenyl phosphate-alpha-L-ara4FN deformylase
MKAGLRIDVDTYRGTRLGVPGLCEILARHCVRGTFFFSVGPDNMGRHIWRLLRPKFLWKMLRTNAAGLYGWDILLRGTFWPGPIISARCAEAIRRAAQEHEVGVHAWDHHQWQAHIDQMSETDIRAVITKAFDMLRNIAGRQPVAFAAPSWKASPNALRVTEQFPFRYQSDCRGSSIFRPQLDGAPLSHPQVPVTLPTYDEVVGPGSVPPTAYNEYILNQIRPNALNVLCIHAEVEGIACRDMFDEFLRVSNQREIEWVPLSELLPTDETPPPGRIEPCELPGREGWIACQV